MQQEVFRITQGLVVSVGFAMSFIAPAFLMLLPRQGEPVAAFVPKATLSSKLAIILAEAGGELIGESSTAEPNLSRLVMRSDRAEFAGDLYRLGAALVVRARIGSGCWSKPK